MLIVFWFFKSYYEIFVKFQIFALAFGLYFLISTMNISANTMTKERGELDTICCPVVNMTRAKSMGFIIDPKTTVRQVAFLYQSIQYKQYLNEIQCRFPGETVPESIRNNDTRCDGECQQLYGSQLVITLQPSPLNMNLTTIEMKIGCKFVPVPWRTLSKCW